MCKKIPVIKKSILYSFPHRVVIFVKKVQYKISKAEKLTYLFTDLHEIDAVNGTNGGFPIEILMPSLYMLVPSLSF